MQKRNNGYPVTSEASLPYTELFGSLSPVYEEEVEEEWLKCKAEESTTFWSMKNSDHSVLDAWELLQEYGDLNCSNNDFPELYDLCVNINDVCCKNEGQKKGIAGPTLAELNERRALSPLINPEMRRLHMEATEYEEPDFPVSDMNLRNQYSSVDSLQVVTKSCVPFQVKHHSAVVTCVDRFLLPKVQYAPSPRNKVEVVSVQPCEIKKEPTDEERWGLNNEKGTDCDPMVEAQNNTGSEEPESVKQEFETTERTVLRDSNAKENYDKEELPVYSEDDDDEDDDDDDDMDSDDEQDSKQAKMLMAKGRRSEAEDWTPNPSKLVEIGKQLDRLNRVIGDLRPINQLPVNSRNKTRREKNKLASRACRLKKKAGHEANKIKLRGLEMENDLLLRVVQSVKDALVCGKESSKDSGVLKKVDLALGNCVAGKLTDFVDTVIKKAATGDSLKGFKHHIKGNSV